MNLAEARAEGQRWLDYLKRQEEKSIAIQKIACQVRRGEIDSVEGKRQLRAIDDRCSVTVYDGARLAEAVALLIRSKIPTDASTEGGNWTEFGG